MPKYTDFPQRLQVFCGLFLDALDYNAYVLAFQQRWPVGVDGRHTLHVHTIEKLLDAEMVYDDGFRIRVKHLPLAERCNVIDYTGFLIGMGTGNGNDSLIGIYRQYWP